MYLQMLSADTPTVISKSCEIFIMELTMRAWMHTLHRHRRTLQRDDIATAIMDDDLFLFLKPTLLPQDRQVHNSYLSLFRYYIILFYLIFSHFNTNY